MPGNKNIKTVKTGCTGSSTRKKPVKLSLADFHKLLDQQKTSENDQKMKPAKGAAEVLVWPSKGTRGRGICFDTNPSDPKHQNHVTQVAGSSAEGSLKASNGIARAKVLREVTKSSTTNRESTKNGHSERPRVIVKNHKTFKKPEELNILSTIPEDGILSNSKITILKRPIQLNSDRRGRSKTRVRSCPRIPTPPRDVPPELKPVDRMTSADFRHDYSAHLENMRSRLKNQEHMHLFKKAIQQNKHLFKDQTILVLCCGPGTLALMVAEAGARRVYAVDYSQVTGYTELVVRENCKEDKIKVIQGRIAGIRLPEKVDGIVCNWMGHCLLFESEILEVLEGRDRWLKEGGFILPDLGTLYILGSEERSLKNDRCNWWLSVYGFNMKAMRQYALAEPRYAKTTGEHILTLAHRILSLDLNTCKKEDLFVDRSFKLQVKNQGCLECFLLYFDVEFSRAHKSQVKMSCNPCLRQSRKNLWHQTVLFVEKSFVMRHNCHYTGHLSFKPLRPDSLKEMEIRIKFFGSENDNVKWDSGYCDRLVAKRWLMLEHFQTVSEVASCQDELEENVQY